MTPRVHTKFKTQVNDDSVIIEVEGKVLSFQRFWLRDQCRCNDCYNHATNQRNLHLLDVPDVSIVKIIAENDSLNILWKDEHTTKYDLKYLMDYTYENWLQSKHVNKVLWNEITFEDLVAHVDEKLFIDTEAGQYKVIKSLVKYGVAFIDNVEPTLEATEKVCEILGGVQYTLFGGMWSFTSNGARADTAYSNNELKPHNDNTYFTEAAGLQVFHLLEHTEGSGGETTLVDGFLGAEKLRKEFPDYFEFLCNHKSDACYLEDGYCHRHTDSVIKVNDLTGEVEQIRYNVYDRTPMAFKNLDESRKYYDAYKKLSEYYNTGVFKCKLKPGQVIAIDNFRVLHGRTSFTGKRIMSGAYVSRSAWLSKAATLGLI